MQQEAGDDSGDADHKCTADPVGRDDLTAREGIAPDPIHAQEDVEEGPGGPGQKRERQIHAEHGGG